MREQLCALDDDRLAEILEAREWEALTMGHRERVTDTLLPHIAELPQVLPGLFAGAAARAQAPVLMVSSCITPMPIPWPPFSPPLIPGRTVTAGPSSNRLRLPLEVFAKVRQQVGEDFPVGCRFLADECIKDGNAVAEAMQIGVALAAAGMDFLSLSRGGKFDDAKQPKVGESAYPYTGVSGYECMPGYISDEFGPYGRNIEPTAAIRAAVRAAGYATPVVVAGGIHTFTQAESLLQQDRADIVAFARQALADPDWFEKVRTGCGAQVRLCEYTNYCEGLDQKHKQVTCNLWDRLELDEPGIAQEPRRPAPVDSPGMEAGVTGVSRLPQRSGLRGEGPEFADKLIQ